MKLSKKQALYIIMLYNQYVVEHYEDNEIESQMYDLGKIEAISDLLQESGYKREHKKWVKESEDVNNANETSDNLPI